jgi:uncharacterized protein
MFPLGSVLLPHSPLVLRVFEPRYLTMIGRLLDEDAPQFGTVLIERGSEAGGGDQRLDIGTMARIVSVSIDDGVLHVVAIGGDRIRVDRWLDDDPHPMAAVTPLPALVWDDALRPLHDAVEHTVRRVLARAAEFSDMRWDASADLSDDAVESAWQLATIAPLAELDRFALLQATTLGGLLSRLNDMTLDVEPLLTLRPLDDDLDDL